MKKTLTALFALLTLTAPAMAKDTLTVYTYDSFVAEWGPGPKVKEAFEKTCDCTVEWVTPGDAVAMLKHAQLLEHLRLFKRSARPREEAGQKRGAVGIKPHMTQRLRLRDVARRAVAMKGNRRAREVQRASAKTDDNLDQIGVVHRLRRGKRRRYRRNIRPRRGVQQLDRGVDGLRLDLRFIALNVDEDVSGNLRGNLGQSAGSVGVIDPRENRGSARSFDGGDDARVIRGNDHGVE